MTCDEPNSYYDLWSSPPRSPLDLIASAALISGGPAVTGVFLNSTTYQTPPVAWTPALFPVSGVPVCSALGSDNFQEVAAANNWNFSHLTWDSNPLLAPPLQSMFFLRAGRRWRMTIPLNLGTNIYPDLQIGFLENAATRGDCQGTIPVISFTPGPYTGTSALILTLNNIRGSFRIGIRAIGGPGSSPTNWYMWETVWITGE
jgi:hypothetical protein